MRERGRVRNAGGAAVFLRFFWVLFLFAAFGEEESGGDGLGRVPGRRAGSGLNGFGYFKSFGLLSVGWVKENKWKRVLGC